jgi:hypothetical protein
MNILHLPYIGNENFGKVKFGTILNEDFENDPADYGLLRFPYLTGNGFLLTGQSSAQILRDQNLLKSGNFIHFRDSKDGLTFGFPDNKVVKAFGFDYRSPEKWQFAFDDSVVPLPGGRGGFVGIVVQKDYPQKFVLSSAERIQGGLSVDNISYFFDR